MQVNTAKRVLKRFCPDKIPKEEKATMTDTEQIAIFKDYYENQIDAMMDREIDGKEVLKQAMAKNEMLKNRIDMLERRVDDLKGQLTYKESVIVELEIKYKVVFEEI